MMPCALLQYERASIGPTGAIAAGSGVCKGPYDALNGSALAWCAPAACIPALGMHHCRLPVRGRPALDRCAAACLRFHLHLLCIHRCCCIVNGRRRVLSSNSTA